MLRSVKSLEGYAIRATDGDLGRVDEFYFDDQTWTIRYLVVETGKWLSNRKVLLSPAALHEADWDSRTFSANLSQEQVRDSPPIDTDKPVSRQHETNLLGYYDWPLYWGSGLSTGGMYGAAPMGPLAYDTSQAKGEGPTPERSEDPHLRSTRRVAGYAIHASDGDLGHVEDYILDDASWALRFLVVATGNWLAGRRVLMPTQWIKGVQWGDARVVVGLSRQEVERSPEFDEAQPVSADDEGRFHDYYGRPSAPVPGSDPDAR